MKLLKSLFLILAIPFTLIIAFTIAALVWPTVAPSTRTSNNATNPPDAITYHKDSNTYWLTHLQPCDSASGYFCTYSSTQSLQWEKLPSAEIIRHNDYIKQLKFSELASQNGTSSYLVEYDGGWAAGKRATAYQVTNNKVIVLHDTLSPGLVTNNTKTGVIFIGIAGLVLFFIFNTALRHFIRWSFGERTQA